jgi:TRAP-type C4-dicarboxylate transport system permease small subunit
VRRDWLRLLTRLEETILLVLFVMMMLVAAYQILARNFFGFGIPWGDGFVKFAVLWMALIGAMLASRRDQHIRIDALTRMLSDQAQQLIRRGCALFTCIVCGIFVWLSTVFVLGEYQFPMVSFGAVPSWVCALIMPVGFAVICVRYLFHTLHPVAFEPPGAPSVPTPSGSGAHSARRSPD